ncbi:MAG: hypothetical protein WCC48_10010 [Anaeromyxobacteraceae bacterium]
MAHQWDVDDVAETLQIALRHPRRGRERDEAAKEFAKSWNAAHPKNRVTVAATKEAIEAAAAALAGGGQGASKELLRQIAALRPESGRAAAAETTLSFEARRIELAIDACVDFPRKELASRQAVFSNLGLEVPPARFFEGVDNAIDGIFDGTVRPTDAVKRRVEMRRRAGTLTCRR